MHVHRMLFIVSIVLGNNVNAMYLRDTNSPKNLVLFDKAKNRYSISIDAQVLNHFKTCADMIEAVSSNANEIQFDIEALSSNNTHQFFLAVARIKNICRLASNSQTTYENSWEEHDMLAYVQCADYFQVSEVLKDKIVMCGPKKIIQQLSDQKNQFLPSEVLGMDSSKEYFKKALAYLSDDGKKELKSIWYERQYANKEFKQFVGSVEVTYLKRNFYKRQLLSLQKFANKFLQKKEQNNLESNLVKVEQAWEESFERSVYRIVANDKVSSCLNFTEVDQDYLHMPAMFLFVLKLSTIEPESLIAPVFDKLVYPIDFEYMARYCSKTSYEKFTFDIKLKQGAYIPWHSFKDFVGFPLSEQDSSHRKRISLIFHCNFKDDQDFYLEKPLSRTNFMKSDKITLLSQLLSVGHLFTGLCWSMSAWYRMSSLWETYHDALMRIDCVLPTAVKQVGSYLIKNQDFLPIKLSVPILSVPAWPTFSGDPSLITLKEIRMVEEVLCELCRVKDMFHWSILGEALLAGLGFGCIYWCYKRTRGLDYLYQEFYNKNTVWQLNKNNSLWTLAYPPSLFSLRFFLSPQIACYVKIKKQ